MKYRVITFTFLVMFLSAFVLAPMSAVAAPAQNDIFTIDVPIDGTFLGGGKFSGRVAIQRFAVEDGHLVVKGRLGGRLTDGYGNMIGTVKDVPVTLQVNIQDARCEILSLRLGPTKVNMLGIEVDLNQVSLEIKGDQGLLGKLLCEITRKIDDYASMEEIAELLNKLFY
jgi:hypothetical protein